ncbi:MAG: Hpt domain-containing protein [Planctomycetales bacterium]
MESPARQELPADQTRSVTPPQEILNIPCALKRLNGSQNLLKDMAVMYLEDVPALFQELKRAIDAGDLEEVTRTAHSISGLSATFEAIPCCSAAKALEASGRQKQTDAFARQLADLDFEIQRLIKALEESVLI